MKRQTNYRKLQKALKNLRIAGVLPKSIKLNQKQVKLAAIYETFTGQSVETLFNPTADWFTQSNVSYEEGLVNSKTMIMTRGNGRVCTYRFIETDKFGTNKWQEINYTRGGDARIIDQDHVKRAINFSDVVEPYNENQAI